MSSKGPRHITTIKSLINYLIALLVYSPAKYKNVLTYVKEEQGIPEYLVFFDAINDVLNEGRLVEGREKLELMPEEKVEEKSKV